MSLSTVDKEISLFSLSLAKDLILQTLSNVDEEFDEANETDITTQNADSVSPPCLKSQPPKLTANVFRQSSKEFLESLGPLQILQMYASAPTGIEPTNEIKSPLSYTEEIPPQEYQLEENTISAAQSNTRAEGSISHIFARQDNSESSVFPFSLLGESAEVLYKKYSKEGYLYKKSSNMFVGWQNPYQKQCQKRFFEVKGFKLYYSKSLEMLKDRKELRCINLFEVKGQTFQISIEGVKKKLRLKATSLIEAKAWIEFLQEVFKFVSDNEAKASKYMIGKREKLLKSDLITEEEFLEKAETGDILLFKSIHLAAKLQRTVTYSKYDHVGITVRAFDDVYLYDSVYNGGVQLTNWRDFKTREYYRDYVRIAYRKLDIKDAKLKQQIQENLFKFVTVKTPSFDKEHTGKKYELSLKKLLKRTSMGPQPVQGSKKDGKKLERKDQQVNAESQEGFFCSELVAAAYKAVGLLDPFVASARYLPVSFSQKKSLKLLRDATLSNEYGLALTDEKNK